MGILIMELSHLISIFGLSNFIFAHRNKIYNILGRSKIGKWIMSPVMIPYFIYALIKLARDEDLILMMLEARKQKKISDYF